MKRLFFLILTAVSITASADDFSLYYDSSSGSKNMEISSVSMLQKIVFNQNGDMVAYQKDGNMQTISIANISRLFFSKPQTVKIETPEDEPAPIINKGVYDLCGRRLNVNPDKDKLPRGIYIINGKKIQVK